MPETHVIGFHESDGGRRALAFAAKRAKSANAKLVIAYVLEWSAYSFLTPQELEERHMRRREELERAQTYVIDPVLAEVRAQGVETDGVIRYGHVAETLLKIAEETGAAEITIGRVGGADFTSRLFGSLPITLVQAATIPVTVVP